MRRLGPGKGKRSGRKSDEGGFDGVWRRRSNSKSDRLVELASKQERGESAPPCAGKGEAPPGAGEGSVPVHFPSGGVQRAAVGRIDRCSEEAGRQGRRRECPGGIWNGGASGSAGPESGSIRGGNGDSPGLSRG